ncbi:MAG: TRAM domain-containing protein, partial [Sulfurimonas sp.]
EDTLDVMKKVKFDQIFSFKYSARPHTEAEHFTNTVDEEIGSARLTQLQSLQAEILDENAQKYLDQVYEVYFEDLNRDNYVSGRTNTNLVVKVKGSEELLGTFAKVKVTQIGRTICTGEIVA